MCSVINRSGLCVVLAARRAAMDPVVRPLSTTACVWSRKTRKPYDKRFTMDLLGSDVGERVPGGTKALRSAIGRRPDMPQPPGYYDKKGRFHFVQEMVPEFIVPDLKDFKLKPYVSYKVTEVKQTEFTAEDLFSSCYAQGIADEYQAGRTEGNDVQTILDNVQKNMKDKTS